jgi:hypothetical protein
VRFFRLLLVSVALGPTSVGATEPLPLKDGDRVVFVGSTLIEREQKYGYWETVLTLREPQKNITFRNLGWSGDTVWGESRCSFDFDKPGEGVRRLVRQVLALKPTVIVLGYGTNEAFAGEAGLPRFRDGLNALLDKLAPANARLALLAPLPMEKHRPPLPDPAVQNKNVEFYRDEIRRVAAQRAAEFIDVLDSASRFSSGLRNARLTDNSSHLTEFGYWGTAQAWLSGAPEKASRRSIKLQRLTSKIELPTLPFPMPPDLQNNATYLIPVRHSLVLEGLLPHRYVVNVDGKVFARFDTRPQGTADDRTHDLLLTRGPDVEQVERLRQTIIAKNELFFHRWRPQNETYLFGFRKHEQGQNAREIPQFDPLVEKLEKEIARLRLPVAHTYELIPEEKVKK